MKKNADLFKRFDELAFEVLFLTVQQYPDEWHWLIDDRSIRVFDEAGREVAAATRRSGETLMQFVLRLATCIQQSRPGMATSPACGCPPIP